MNIAEADLTKRSFMSKARREIRELAEEFGLPESKAFMAWVATILLDIDADEAYEATRVDRPNDKSIDLFWLDQINERAVIGQGKFSSKGTARSSESSMAKLLNSPTAWLRDPSALERDGRYDLAEAARQHLEARRKGYFTELWYVCFGEVSPGVRRLAGVWNAEKREEGKSVKCVVLDLKLIQQLYEESLGRRTRIKQHTIALEPHLAFEQRGSYGRAVIATLKGKQLAQMYSQHGDDLFARNVRLFLGKRRGSVNAGIAATLESDTERSNFWAFNNGVTIVCDNFTLSRDKQRLTLRNFSIVNGCQTTVSLHDAAETLNGEVRVLTKIVSPPERQIDRIIQYTNSQNQIRPWDIRTQDKTQFRIQNELSVLAKPYHYSLRRGEAPTGAARRRFLEDGKIRSISFVDVGQYLGALRGRTLEAYKEKSLLFTNLYEEVFPVDIAASGVIFAWHAGEVTKHEVREAIKQATLREEKTTVRILSRGGKIYALAVVGQLIEFRSGVTFLSGVSEDRIGSSRALDRMRGYAKAAVIFYVQAVKDMMETTGDDLNVLLRSADYLGKIKERVRSAYELRALDDSWVKSALPKIY